MSRSGAPAAVDALRIDLLGSFTCVVDGSALSSTAWKSRKALEVCAFAALAGAAGVSREQAIEAVWPDRPPEKGRTLLRTALSEIRRVLEPRRSAGQESRFVSTSGDRVIVVGATDLGQARQHVEMGEHAGAFGLLAKGLAPDVPQSDWVEELRPVIERLTIESASRVSQSTDHQSLVVPAFEALIAAEPWNQDHFLALAAHHREAGDSTAADDVERRWFADD